MTRVLARCPETGNAIPTGMDWTEEGPALPSAPIRVFCPDCARIHDARPFLEAPIVPSAGLEDVASA